eukprot:4344800-Alexandrium_andersonii.AAC.1
MCIRDRCNAEQAHDCDSPPLHCVRAGGGEAGAAKLVPPCASALPRCAQPCSAGCAPAGVGRLRKAEPHLGGRKHCRAPASCGRFPTRPGPGCW